MAPQVCGACCEPCMPAGHGGSSAHRSSSARPVEPGCGFLRGLRVVRRAFVYHNFLSSEECDHLVTVARPQVPPPTPPPPLPSLARYERSR